MIELNILDTSYFLKSNINIHYYFTSDYQTLSLQEFFLKLEEIFPFQ